MGGEFDLESVNFTFMLWDHTAQGVKMGCLSDGDKQVFVVRYDSPVNGKRIFMGTPWLADCSHHELNRELASSDTISQFLQQARFSVEIFSQ